MPSQHHDYNQTETLYTLDEAAQELQVHKEALQQAMEEGIFRGIEKDGLLFLPAIELDRAKNLLAQNHQAQLFEETDSPVEDTEKKVRALILMPGYKGTGSARDWQQTWKDALSRISEQIRRLQESTSFSSSRIKKRLEKFFHLIEFKKKKEVKEEFEQREVSLKLGFMTGQNEMFCDFCEVHDRFYPGAIFADVYIDGTLKWMMCPNCLYYCQQQANGSMEENIRTRFHQLAHRLEKEAFRARRLATSENFRVPPTHEWEAWQTASYAMQEVAAAQAGPQYSAEKEDDFTSF